MTDKSFVRLVLLAAVVLAAAPAAVDHPGVLIAPVDLRCEDRPDPLGLDSPRPRLSWVLASDGRAEVQSAFRILVARSLPTLETDRGDLWDSGKVRSAESLGLAYAGPALRSGQRCFWKVRVWDGRDRPSAWSPAASWEMALLEDAPWKARWIGDGKPSPADDEDFYRDDPAPLFRKEFIAPKRTARARLYISGLGYYEASINGRRVGDRVLDPGWTNYEQRVFYSVYDVTASIRAGLNCIGVMLGNGWWNPLPLRMWGNRNLRADLPVGRPCLIAQLVIEGEDGKEVIVATGPEWQVREGPVLRNNIYLGEVYDARREIPGWDSPGANETGWTPAVLCPGPPGALQAQPQPPIRVTARLRPIRVSVPRPGAALYDFGRNFAGWARLRLRAPAGTRIRIRFGELLDVNGNLNPLTSVCGQIKGRRKDGLPVGGLGAPDIAEQADIYIARGGGEEIYTPRFTFHGFRYAEVTGLPDPPNLDDLEGLRLSADVSPSGEFSCSNDLFNRIQDMVRWTFLSNIFSVQSDCPHREKFGYGGDLVATADAFLANFDMAGFYAKATADWADAAREDGMLTDTAPFVGIQYCGPAWAMAHPFLQVKLVQHYGNRRLVEEQFDTTRRWLDLVTRTNPDGLIREGLADHESLEPTSVPALVTPLYHETALLTSRLAGLLGRRDDEERFRDLAAFIAAAYRDKVLGPGPDRYETMTQAGLAVALGLGLIPDAEESAAFNALTAKVSSAGGPRLTTGIFGTKFLLDVLSRRGRADLAWALVDRKDFPGWGHMLDRGATTLWEHWEFSDNTYSHNHPMFGSVSEWFFAWVAGIQPDPAAIGFDKIIIRPQPVGDLTWAKAGIRTVRGEVRSEWRIERDRFLLTVVIPANTTAAVYVPSAGPEAVREGGAPAASAEGLSFRGLEAGNCVYAVGSGRYEFSVNLLPRPLSARGLPAAGSR
ncbi:MAG: family 78 glycoside hydrolase catalytic domain [Candidatus Aminicenantes bacterium]|nr:family 78 glycoside hydrolase catalytic domain [Candidatus Aminicenantes bacterium]